MSLSSNDVGRSHTDKRKKKMVSPTRLLAPVTRSKTRQLELIQVTVQESQPMDPKQGKEGSLVLIDDQEIDVDSIGVTNVI